jgi:hypothetical protein
VEETAMLKTIEMVFILLGLVLAFVGGKFSMPFLFDAGVACLGLGCIAIGWDAIFTRQLTIGSRRRGNRYVYTGLAAVLQGIEFNILGLFLIVFALMLYANVNPRAIGVQIARHPGLLLVILGIIILIQAAVVFVGYKQSGQWNVFVDLILLRLIPGIILVVLGLGLLGLGVFEIIAPNAFDAMGGALLESLYGL